MPSTSNNPSSSGIIDYRRATPGTAHWERTLWKKLEVGDIVVLRETVHDDDDDGDNKAYNLTRYSLEENKTLLFFPMRSSTRFYEGFLADNVCVDSHKWILKFRYL